MMQAASSSFERSTLFDNHRTVVTFLLVAFLMRVNSRARTCVIKDSTVSLCIVSSI